jgi:hypothetical protein
MKKIYVSPRIEINDYMTVSGLMQVPVTASGQGIGFGGSDGGGSGAPEAKQYRYSVWDEEE